MSQSTQDQRKYQILDAALEVIVRKGYEGSSMSDIVKKSKLSKGAIYWYYSSKKEVYLALVNHWVHQYSPTLNLIIEDNQPASVQLKGLFNFFITQYETDPTIFKAIAVFWSLAGRDNDFKEKFDKVYSEFFTLIEKIIIKGVESKEFKNIDTKIAALSIMVNIESAIWFTLFENYGISATKYMETITDFILAGLIK
ncbi:TetR/AcrR family transcriptional regulator [bacterium]|nr:TetR/AcrR family transcriptional regulator [bacterium]